MAVLTFSREDIARLADRLEARANSRLVEDQAQLRTDILSAALLLRFMLEKGVPVSTAEVNTR